MLCALSFPCHFSPFNRCGNSPPREPQKVVRHERTTQGESIDGRLVGGGEGAGQGQVFFPTRVVLEPFDRGPEVVAVAGGQGPPGAPDVGRGDAVQAARAGAGVGLLAGGFDEPAGPEVRVAGMDGQAVRSRFQRADGSFDRAIILGPAGR